MPIYEYRCRACGETFERIQRLPSDSEPCPHCGEAARRSVSLTSPGGATATGGCAPRSGFG